MTYENEHEAVQVAMQEPADTAELQIERRIDCLLRDVNEFLALANDPASKHLLKPHWRAFDQAASRLQLAASSLEAEFPNKFRPAPRFKSEVFRAGDTMGGVVVTSITQYPKG